MKLSSILVKLIRLLLQPFIQLMHLFFQVLLFLAKVFNSLSLKVFTYKLIFSLTQKQEDLDELLDSFLDFCDKHSKPISLLLSFMLLLIADSVRRRLGYDEWPPIIKYLLKVAILSILIALFFRIILLGF